MSWWHAWGSHSSDTRLELLKCQKKIKKSIAAAEHRGYMFNKNLEGKLISYSRYLSDDTNNKLSIITNHGIIIRHPSNNLTNPHGEHTLTCDVLWTDGLITKGVNVRSLNII